MSRFNLGKEKIKNSYVAWETAGNFPGISSAKCVQVQPGERVDSFAVMDRTVPKGTGSEDQ